MTLFIIFLLTLSSFLQAQDIIYEKADTEGLCLLPSGKNGICREGRLCPEAYDNFPIERPVHCGFRGKNPIVCCSVKIDRVSQPPDSLHPVSDISPPSVDFECGDSSQRPVFAPGLSDSLSSRSLFQTEGVGGEPARLVLVKYSAILGVRDQSGAIDWFCTGVLLNHFWVLTAAHCLVERRVDVVRLGEYDYQDEHDGAQPEDFEVAERILHPGFSHPLGYHDLALLKLSRLVNFGLFINPVCLPWGLASSRDLINQQISLTGWGATEFGGSGSSIPQEVNVTVFPTSACDQSYSELRNYDLEWPQGITLDILCAGDPAGGKDACQGDSGGPVVYLDELRRYVLAGVVSRGYGCGLKDFPGLYANIHHPPYLAWIKQVAFQ